MTEYRVIFLTNTSHEATAEMNHLAKEGWHFVSRIGSDRSMGVIMSREQVSSVGAADDRARAIADIYRSGRRRHEPGFAA